MSKTATVEDRYQILSETEEILRQDSHRHMELGGHYIERELPKLKALIFAQVYGILSEGDTHDSSRRAFRWLLAHTDKSAVSYNPKKETKQWENIMEYYLRKNHGHYAEVALLERLLLSIHKANRSNIPLTDVFIADRSADYSMMTDWIMHHTMTHGTLHMGVQLSTGKSLRSKLNDFHKRPLHDKKYINSQNVSPTMRDFMRHNTAVLSFPRFRTSDASRARALRFLLSGSPRYQSEMIATAHNKTFNDYGRQVLEALDYFHQGIMDRVIDHRARLHHHEFKTMNEKGETISGSIMDNAGIPIATIKVQEPRIKTSPFGRKPVYSQPTVLSYSVPIFPDFLDLYRDMAGVRAI